MNRRLTIFITWCCLCFLALAAPLHSAVRINEVMFDPDGGDSPDLEFIELYNDGGGSVDLLNWSLLVDGILLKKIDSSYVLGPGSYVVLYLGNPVAPPSNSLSLGFVTEQLGDNGDEILLTDASDTAVDYIAYGTAVANPPAALAFPTPVSLTYWQIGDSIAFLQPSGANSDDSGQWLNRRGANVTPGSENTQQAAPTLSYGAISVPAAFPEVNSCAEIEVPIIINYSSETPVYNVAVEFTVPAGFLFVSATGGGSFNDPTRTLSWTVGTLNGDQSLSLRLRPDCSVTSGAFAASDLNLSFRRYSSQVVPDSLDASNSIGNFTVQVPSLDVTMGQYLSNAPTIVASIGTIVEFQFVVSNNGSGSLSGDGAELVLKLAPNLALVGFRQTGPLGQPILNLVTNPASGIFTGNTGSLAPGQSRLFYVKALTVACVATSGCAQVEVSWGCADSSPGSQNCNVKADAGASVVCPPLLSFVVPAGQPAIYSGCQDVTRNIVISNPNGVPLEPQNLTVNLPPGYYWVSSKIGGVDVGSYNQAAKTISFTAAELSSGSGAIAGYSAATVVLIMRPGCEAGNDRIIDGEFSYQVTCPRSGVYAGAVSGQSATIKLRQPALAVAVQDPANPLKTTVLAERGETVTFKVVVYNNGLGNLDSAGKPPGEEGGWLELGTVGAGLSLQSVRDISAGMPGVDVTPAGAPLRWPSGVMAAGSTKSYLVDFLVVACENVNYDIETYWECAGTDPADSCRQDGESKGSVNILLRNPSLSIAPVPFVVDYCNGATVTIPVSNAPGANIGAARNVSVSMFGMNLSQFTLSDGVGSDFEVSVAGNLATFTLVDGQDSDGDTLADDIRPGSSYDIVVDVKISTGVCDASNSGLLIFQPYYEDSCGIPYTTGTQLAGYSRTDPPTVGLSKSGPAVGRVGDSNLSWTMTLTYTGTPGADLQYTFVDNYPDAVNNLFGSFTMISFADSSGTLTAGVDYTDNGDTISRSVSTTFDVNGNYSETYTIVFDAPTTVCAGGRSYTNNATVTISKPATPVDCNSCELPSVLNASSSITLNNRDEDHIDQHNRLVTYKNINVHNLDNSTYQAAGETCTELTFNQLMRFTAAAPAAWSVDVDPGAATDIRPLRFRDDLNQRLRAPGGLKENLAIEIYYFAAGWQPGSPSGSDYGPGGTALVTWSDITYVAPSSGADGSLEIDLSALNSISGAPKNPSDQGILWIRYTVQSQEATAGSFTDFAKLVVPLEGGDPCSLGEPETEYYHLTNVTVADPVATVSISNVSSPDERHIDRCETLTLRFNLGIDGGHPFDVYDARLTVDLGSNYSYIASSSSFGSGLKDEGGNDFTSFEPDEDGSTLSWNLGDLRNLAGSGGGRYIDIQVQKNCAEASTLVSATVYSNTQCNQADDTNGPGDADSQDTAIAALTSFDNNRSGSYQPLLYSGRLETRFASERVFYNDGYPTALLHVVNSGNGTLYNARIPVELGSLINGSTSLTYVEAYVTAVSGSASVSADLINPIVPITLGPLGSHGYREITLGIDWMEPSSIVTIQLRLRMVLCADLSLRIVQSHWGCPAGKDDACPVNLLSPELNSAMEIRSGNARALVVEHSATPSVIDLCGSKTHIAIEVLNAGSVDVYEASIRGRLPEGMVILPDSVKYSINGGPLIDFPEASGAGKRYSRFSSTNTPGVGDYQTIHWVFTDPNLDHNESDSLLSSPSFDDPFPADPFFERHDVMKPATRIRIEFDALLDGCDNALAYQKSDKKSEAALIFDLPCHHDNRINPDGSPAAGGNRAPLDDNTRDGAFLDPGLANLTIDLNGQNLTQSGLITFSQVNAELGDSIEWTTQLNSLGSGVVPNPVLEILVPDILSVNFASTPPIISSPANLVFVNNNPAGVPEANGTRYSFVFRNTDPAMIAADREYYFAANENVTVIFQSVVNACTAEKPTVQAIVRWGCCTGTPGLEDASGMDQTSTAVKTKPDPPTISIVEGDGGLMPQFNSCLGAYTITLNNPSINSELSIWDIDVDFTLPNGWAYAPLSGDGSNFLYSGPGARPAPDQLSALEEEPLIVGNVLRWTSVTRGGSIPDNKARLFPREQVQIIVYLRADGTGVNCDLDGTTNPVVPNFTQNANFAYYRDSCADPLNSPINAAVLINPEHPSINISLLPSTRFIGNATPLITWELRIQNTGDIPAEDITLEIDFAAGYSSVNLTGGAPAPTQAGNSFTWALGSIAPLAPNATMLWNFTGNIDLINRDDLSSQATVRGYCRERDDSLGCTYAFAETDEYISGAAISKAIDGTRLQSPAISTDPAANDPNAIAADVSIGSIIRHLLTVELYEGGETDIIVRELLPAGLEFLEANLVDQAGNLVTALTPSSTTGNLITFSHSSIPAFADITGGKIGSAALFIEIWVRVLDSSINLENATLENTAQLTVIRGNQVFDHTTPALGLFDSTTLTIREPFIRNDADLSKLSDPLSLPANHVGPVLDIEPRPAGENPIAYTFTAKNTGSSPAYELEITDLFPWQFSDPTLLVAPYELVVTITPSSGPPARTLVKNTDFSSSWTAGVSPNTGTFKINLLSTTNAILGIDETITVSYHGQVETFAPGTFLDNSADISKYSSLPGTGATLVTARSTNLLENGAERQSYGDSYRNVPVKRTYHKFTEELVSSAAIIAEITPLADGVTLPAFRDDGSTRATLGEQIEYWLRLSLPQLITLHDLAFTLDLPDGLTVRAAQWEVVLAGADFSGGEKNLAFTELGSGISEVRGQAGAGGDDFPQPLTNNTANDQEMLVKVLFTVDRNYSGGSAVLAGNAFNLPATFSWDSGSDSSDPIPAFTVVEPELSSLTKTRSAHLQADNATPAVSPGNGTYNNYNPIGPDNAGSPTNPVTNVYQVRPTDIVEYTVTLQNDGTATAWNIELRDTIPAGMTLRPGSSTIVSDLVDANISISDPVPSSVVTFAVNRILPGHKVTITYRCNVDADVAVGRYLQNQAEIVQYSSLPEAPFNPPIMPTVAWPGADRSVTSGAPDQYSVLGPVFEKVGTEFPSSSKTIESELTAPLGQLKDGSSRASIGELISYELRLDLPDTSVFYDLEFSDIVPDGLTVRSASYSYNAGPPVAMTASVNPNGTTTVTATANPFGDLAGLTGVIDEIVITITATVGQTYVTGGASVVAGDIFANNATFTWNQVNDDGSTVNSQNVEPAPVTFTIVEPKLETLTKAKASVTPPAFSGPGNNYRNYNPIGPNANNSGPVNNVDQVVPGHIVLYTVTVSNNGDGIAYDIDLSDDIPEGMSYVPGSASIGAGPNPTTIAFRNVPTVPTLPSRTLEFQLNYLEPGNIATLEYQLQVDTPVGAGRFLLNQVNLVDYRSMPATAAYPDAARDTDAPAPNYSPLGPALAYVGTAFPSASKTVASEFSLPSGKLADGSARGSIGEVMTYELLIDIPDDTVLYDLLVEDILPANLTVQPQNLLPADISFAVVNNNGVTTTYGSATPQLSIVGNTVGLYLESDVRAQNGVTNEIRIVIAVTVDDVAANAAGTVFENNLTTSWNQVDENPGTPAGRGSINSFVTPDPAGAPDSVDFTVIEPAFAAATLTKTRNGHFLADGVSAATSPGTATYRNYNPAGPISHLSALDPVPNVYQVRPTEIVEYSVTFVNSGDARAYDIDLLDSVPAGFTLLTAGVNVPTITGGSTVGIAFLDSTPTQAAGSGTPINFTVNWLDPGQTCTITFRTQIEPGISAGAYLQNQMSMTDFGSSPDASAVFPALERDTSSAVPYTNPNPKFEKVGSEYPLSSKTIQTELTSPAGKLKDGSSRASIGELITYEILIDIKDNLVLYDLNFADFLPDGLSAIAANYNINLGGTVAMSIAAQGNGTTLITDTAMPLADVSAVAGVSNEIVIIITATVDQTFVTGTGATDNGPFGVGGANSIVDAGDIFANNATLTWNQVNDQPSENSQDIEPAPVTFTIVEPRLDNSFNKVIVDILDFDGSTVVTSSRGHTGIVSGGMVPAAAGGKTSFFRYPPGGGNPTLVADVQVVLPDDYVEYRVSVSNSGNARAFDVKIRDLLPPVAKLSYSSGSGTFALGTEPYTAGSADSQLSITSSTVNVAGVDHTQLDFSIDMLAAGETATITYRAQVLQGLGAGHYIGPNVANLLDVGSLPDATFAVPVGNLAAGNNVFDNARERDTSSTPAYAAQGPKGDDIGVQYPEFNTRVYRRYDLAGTLTDTLLATTTNLHIGDILIYELEAVLPRHTTLFDGGAPGNALAFRHRLNRGYHVIAASEEFAAGDIDLTALHQAGSPPTPYTVIGTQQYPTWFFDDIANSAGSSQTAILRFQAEVKTTEYSGAPYFIDQTTAYSLINRSYLFWNTADQAEKNTLQFTANINNGDHPFLQRDSVTTSVVQPNLLLSKNSVPVPGSFIGVSSFLGDLVTYTLTLRNWNSASAGTYRGRGSAYNLQLTDILPKDLAPIAPVEPLLTAAIHSINTTTGATAGLLRSLTRNSDYNYNYASDPVSLQGTITFTSIRDAADYDSRIDVNTALVITYQVNVNPDIGAQGSGAGQRVNQALLEEYYSFPETINDPSRKQYGPDGPRRVSILTEVPGIDKTSPNAGESILPGGIVEYTLLAPKNIIRANLYEVEFRDTIPDGLSFAGDGSSAGVGPGPVTLNLGDAIGQVPGNEVVVTGGHGAVSITVSGRNLTVTVERIDADGGDDQVTVVLRALVKTSFDNAAPIARLHEFSNTASLLWYDDDNTFAARSRYATLSPAVSHFFDARGILFEPSHTGTAQPATIRVYRHLLRNFEDELINIPLTFSSTQSNWIWQLFLGDGEGNMVSGPFESGVSVPVPANGVTEVIVRCFVPAEITSLTTDVLTITANGALDNIITVSDVTVVQVERIAVFKDISTTGAYDTRLTVNPDQNNAINQRIRFTNNGAQDVKEIYIYDFIPENTAYIANSAVNSAEFGLQYSKDGGVNWLLGEPATNGETIVNGTVPSVTNLRWYYDAGGILVPGIEKTVTFQIRIK